MNSLTGTILILLFVGVTTFCRTSLPAYGAEQAAISRVEITIKGMICVSCSRDIEKILKGLSGVASVKVDLANDRATVTYDSRKVTSLQLVETIRKSGYEAILPTVPHRTR